MRPCLGRLARPPDRKFVRLSDHLIADLPPAPAVWDGTPGAVWKMYGNDQLGDCVVAGMLNLASLQLAGDGQPGVGWEQQMAKDYYFKLSGGADSGLVMVDALRALQKGLPVANGYAMQHFAGIELGNTDHLRACAAYFNGVLLGVALPDNWEDGLNAGWWADTSLAPDPEEGHCIVLSRCEPDWATVLTWGGELPVTYEWLSKYLDEAYVLIDAQRLAGDILNGEGLIANAAALASQSGAGG